MTYRSNYKLAALVYKMQKLIMANLFSTFLFVILPCSFAIAAEDGFEHTEFWLFVAGIIVINTVTFLGLYRKGKVLNRTIEIVEIDGSILKVKTFDLKILGFKLLKSIEKSALVSKAVIETAQYPFKDKDYLESRNCFIMKFDAENLYLLDLFFDDDLAEVIENFKNKKA